MSTQGHAKTAGVIGGFRAIPSQYLPFSVYYQIVNARIARLACGGWTKMRLIFAAQHLDCALRHR
jgi:hypothetical protein